MPKLENTQHTLDRIRPPRVQITYDVEIGDAIEKKELPLVAGILADLGGNSPRVAQPPLKKRRFVEIDRDNFDAVMMSITPGLEITVANLLKAKTADGKHEPLKVKDLRFAKMDDFDPVAVLKQVPELKALFEARQRLSDLATKLDGNDELEDELRGVVALKEKPDELKALLPPAGGDKKDDEKEDK
jgi:type VI secretion system protein ImpB